MKLHFAAVALLFCCAGDAAFAQHFCMQDKAWSCFGSIAVSCPGNGSAESIRMHVFANGEIMVESENAQTGEAKLLILASGRRLLSGVQDEQINHGFPFIFFDYAFAYPLLALQAAYPSGFESVPQSGATPVVFGAGISGTLLVNRVSADKLQYQLTLPAGACEGFVERAKKLPLPDSMRLDSWKDMGLRRYATLAEARAHRDSPQGAIASATAASKQPSPLTAP